MYKGCPLESIAQDLVETLPMFKKPAIVLPVLAFLLALTSCSEIPENNDPVLGVWSSTELIDAPEGKSTLREEWIFNDAYLGRYHVYRGVELEIETDFSWQVQGTLYRIEYPGLDRPADRVTIQDETPGPSSLITPEGITLAHKE